MASWFSEPTSYEFEVIAAGASGDLAYVVGYEHNVVKVDGEWKIVHRHADPPPPAADNVQLGGAAP